MVGSAMVEVAVLPEEARVHVRASGAITAPDSSSIRAVATGSEPHRLPLQADSILVAVALPRVVVAGAVPQVHSGARAASPPRPVRTGWPRGKNSRR